MKNAPDSFVEYNQMKLLGRLYTLSVSKLDLKCLLEFDKASSIEWSTNFQNLNRECLKNWSDLYGKRFPQYAKLAFQMSLTKTSPITKKYYQSSVPTEFTPTTIDKDLFEKTKEVEFERKAFIEKLKKADFSNLKDRQLNVAMDKYKAKFEVLRHHPLLDSLLDAGIESKSPEDQEKISLISSEANFGDFVFESFKNRKSELDTVGFMNDFQDTNNAFFPFDMIDLKESISAFENRRRMEGNESQGDPNNFHNEAMIIKEELNEIKARSSLKPNDPLPKRSSDDHDNYIYQENQLERALSPDPLKRSNKFKEESSEMNYLKELNNRPDDLNLKQILDQNYYKETNFKKSKTIVNDPPRFASIKNKDPLPNQRNDDQFDKEELLSRENRELAREIEELEAKKRGLERETAKQNEPSFIRQNSRQDPNPQLFPPLVDGYGFHHILRKKDEQIDKLSTRINKLQNECKQLSSQEDSEMFEPKRRDNLYDDLNLPSSAQKQNNFSRFGSDRKVTHRRPIRNTENTGTFFVDQMFKDINRFLNKPVKNSSVSKEYAY